MKAGIFVVVAVGLVAMAPSPDKSIGPNRSDQQKEIHQSYDLPANSVVEVHTIPGSVVVETGSGQTTQIDATLTSPTPADLDCNRLTIERTADGLRLNGDSPCNISRGSQQIRLRLPSQTNLRLSTIAGSIKVPALDGFLRLNSIAGHAEITCTADAEMSSLARGLTLSLSNMRGARVNVSSVNGDIDLGIAADVDAVLTVSSFVGRIQNEVTNDNVTDRQTDFRLRLGAGRSQIRISSIQGDIRIHH
jgi:hypothetical protein